jgi:hypothetical protein
VALASSLAFSSFAASGVAGVASCAAVNDANKTRNAANIGKRAVNLLIMILKF